jgi:hypothetical protein
MGSRSSCLRHRNDRQIRLQLILRTDATLGASSPNYDPFKSLLEGLFLSHYYDPARATEGSEYTYTDLHLIYTEYCLAKLLRSALPRYILLIMCGKVYLFMSFNTPI